MTAVAATLTETRQFYTLYNTLEDQKAYMEKEVCCAHALCPAACNMHVHVPHMYSHVGHYM